MSDSDTPQDVPAYTRWNPPGRTQLSYRAGTYSTVLQRLTDYLATQQDEQNSDDADTSIPELRLNTDPQENWGVGLLQAWAIVVDVLTFYQERIANEGYLRTATERRSIIELARATGYELRPGVSAETHLAFTVGPLKNGASLSCVIPRGTPVQSVPTQGQKVLSFPDVGKPPAPPQLPQTFETSEEFTVRSEWNTIKPARTSNVSERTFRPGITTSLRLDGVKTGLQPGDALLLVGDDPAYTAQNRPWLFISVKTVDPDPKQWYTQVTWDSGTELRHSNDPTPIKNPQVFALRQQAKLFGYTRGGIYYSPLDTADWSSSGIGLPNTTVYTLIMHKNGGLFAGTDNGVFRSVNDGETWESASSGLLKMKVQALTSSDDGTLYAGSSTGNVFFSDDNGNNWRLVTSRPARRVGLLALLPLPAPKGKSLPKTVIHALTTYTDGKTQYLVAATDDGVFQSPDWGLNWSRPPAAVSEQEVTKRGSAWSLPFRRQESGPGEDSKIPFVGMDTGAYPVEVKRGINWRWIGSIAASIVAVIALVLFILGVWNEIIVLGALPSPLRLADVQSVYNSASMQALVQISPGFPTPFGTCNSVMMGCVGPFPAYLVALLGLVLMVAFLIVVFLIVGQRPLLEANNGKFTWAIQHWHGLRNAAIISVIVATLLYIPAALSNDTRLSYSGQFGVLFVLYSGLFYNFLRFLLIGYFILAVLFAIFLLILWLIQRPKIAPLPAIPVRALTYRGDGALLVGTAQGIYRSQDGGQDWEWVQQSPLTPIIFNVPVDANLRVEDLNAGNMPDSLRNAFTNNGIELAQDGALVTVTAGQRWTVPVPNSSQLYVLSVEQGNIQVVSTEDIRAFSTGSAQYRFAGTQDGRVFRADGNGDSWSDFSAKNLHLAHVQALVADARGLFAAGLPDSTDADNQWSRFQLQSRRVDLDKLYPKLVPNGTDNWIVLRQDGAVAVYKVDSVETSVNKDFKKGKDFTSIVVETGDQLSSFDRNATTVLMQSELLPLFDDQPIQGESIAFDSFVPGLSRGQKLLVSGKQLRLRVTGLPTASLVLQSADLLQQIPFMTDDTLVVMGITTSPSSNKTTWQLKDRNGNVGFFTAPLEAISYEPAGDQDEVVSELVSVSDVSNGSKGTTTVTLAASLSNVYDRSSTTICANVVRATHGQTIEGEVLGSVDFRRDKRRFKLKQQPLTYTSAVDAEEHKPDTLLVLVNGVPWHQAQSFYNLSSSTRRIYVLQSDSKDYTWLLFGNGDYGAHLPSGSEHITATYRIGSGAVGNVAANSLTTMRLRLPGIQKVTNPVPASGGADPEANDMVRVNAPLHVQQTMLRIVSFKDYEHFARAYAGIGKVQVKSLWTGRRHLLYMTIASEDGQEISKASDFYQNFQSAIKDAMVSLTQPLSVDPCETLYFQLQADLVLEPDYVLLKDEVKTTVTEKLADTFGFANRVLAQSISASEVITVMQQVPGVAGVKLKSLYYRSDKEASLKTFLEAKPGRLEAGIPQPAQLLLINPDAEGIRLNVE